MGTQVCDKQELYESCCALLDSMEEEIYSEEYSLAFNSAWQDFEEMVTLLGLELANGTDAED